jgi:hypothetical protein
MKQAELREQIRLKKEEQRRIEQLRLFISMQNAPLLTRCRLAGRLVTAKDLKAHKKAWRKHNEREDT